MVHFITTMGGFMLPNLDSSTCTMTKILIKRSVMFIQDSSLITVKSKTSTLKLSQLPFFRISISNPDVSSQELTWTSKLPTSSLRISISPNLPSWSKEDTRFFSLFMPKSRSLTINKMSRTFTTGDSSLFALTKHSSTKVNVWGNVQLHIFTKWKDVQEHADWSANNTLQST